MKKLILLPFLLLGAAVMAQTFPVVPLKISGADDRRINIVVLPDGFTAAQLPLFQSVADTTATKIFQETPLKEYAAFFNVHCVNVPSIDSGTDHPANATDVAEPVIPFEDVNTYFDCSFDGGFTHRALVCNNTGAALSVLASSFPSYDQIIMLANSFEYGGTGGMVATFSRNVSSIETARHELGHSFAHLADEYWAGSIFADEKPNMTAQTDTAVVKWHNWLHVTGVLHYPYGTSGEEATWFRPHQNCKMQFLNRPFCRVCQEAFIDRIYELVTPIDSAWPDNTATAAYTGTPITFSMKLVRPLPNTLKIKWRLNGTTYLPSTDTTVTITSGMLSGGLNDLTAFVTDTTTLSRSYRPLSGYEFPVSWMINNTVGVIDISAPTSGEKFFYKIFPVPVKDALQMSYDNNTQDRHADYHITDMSGRQVKAGTIELKGGKQTLTIDAAGLAPGAYILNMSSRAIDVHETIVVE